MKKWTKILLGALVCIVAVFGGVVYWQWNTVEAVVQAAQYTSEEIEAKQKENKEKVQQAIASDPALTVRDLTEEEKQALRDGSMTAEELTEKLLETTLPQQTPPSGQENGQTPQAGAPTGQAPQSAPQTPKPAEVQTPPATETAAEGQWQRDLSGLVAQVYIMQEEYTIALDSMEEEAKAEYHTLRNRTKKSLIQFAQGYVKRAMELEKTCDARMDDIVAKMEHIIAENGGNMTLVDTVVETYASEKSLKKASYMAELEKRGWI